MKKSRPILVKMLKKYRAKRPLRLHIPAHKGRLGRGFGAKYDITELPFSDNLASPSGVIAQAESAFAALFGAQSASFLVGGASLGVRAMLLCARGEILVCRNSHMSVFYALAAFKKTAHVLPQKDFCFQKIIAEIDKNPSIKTVFITSPDYYGRVFENLDKLSAELSVRGILLFIDGAHGAHFGLSPILPPSVCDFCDAAVVSAHKTLGALGQSAVLFYKTGAAGEMRRALQTLQTTSPSYLLLASIDYSRVLLQNKLLRRDIYKKIAVRVQKFGKSLPPSVSLEKTDDPCKLVLNIKNQAFFSFLPNFLQQKCRVFVEMFDTCGNIVCVLSPFDPPLALWRLLRALKKAHRKFFGQRGQDGDTPLQQKIWAAAQFDTAAKICFNEFDFAQNYAEGGDGSATELISAENCAGRIFAGIAAGVMPPCTPLVLFSGTITQDVCEILTQAPNNSLFGLFDAKLPVKKAGQNKNG